MASNKEITDQIAAALVERTGHPRPCSVCGKTNWYLIQKYVHLSVTTKPGEVMVGGQGFPLQPLICNTCGNTHLLNLAVLGFTDLDSLKYSDEDGK